MCFSVLVTYQNKCYKGLLVIIKVKLFILHH